MNGNILNNIYDKLSQDNLVDVDFDAWQSNFVQDPEVVGNVYNYLSQQGLVTAEPDEWVKNINEELAAQQPKVEEKPKTEDEIREIVSESLPTASAKAAKYLDNVGYAVKSLFTDKEERQETKEALDAVGFEVKRRSINTFINKLPATFAQFYKSIGFDDLYDSEELEYLKTQDPNAVYVDPMGDPTGFKTNADRIKYLEGYESSSAGLAEKKVEDFIVEKMKVAEISDKYLRKDTGEGIVKGIKQGDASDIIGGVFNAGASMVETVVPAMLTGGMSIPFQITAPMITEYNQRKAETIYGKDDPDAVRKLFENDQQELLTPAALGVVASTAEYAGFKGVSSYLLGKAATSNAGKLILTGNKEGLTELFQSGIDEVNTASAEGKDGLDLAKAWIDGVWSEKGLESYLQGFIGGTGMSAGGRAINRALRSDNASIKEVNNKIDFIADLNFAKNQTKDIDIKEAINLEIKEAEQDLKDYINEKRKLNKVLTAEEKTSLIDILNKKDGIKEKAQSLRAKLENGTINRKEFGYAIRSLNNQDKKLSDQLSEIQSTAVAKAAEKVTETVRKQVGKIAKAQGVEGTVTEATGQEILDMQGEKLARLTAERDSNQEFIDDPNETAENKKIAEENVKDLQRQIDDVENADATFGYIDEKIDDKGDLTGDFEIVINKDKPMIGTAAHEFMHKVLFKTLKGNKDLQTKVGDAVTTFINEEKEGFSETFVSRMSAYISPIKDKDGKVVRDKDGNVQFEKVSEFGEEVVTVMSESILDGSLKYNENLFTKLGDIIRQNLQRYGFKSIEFNTGRDVYNFIKDFNKSIEKDYTSKAITEMAVKGAKGKLVEGKKKAKPKAKRKMSKVSPRADQFIKAEINNEMLVDIVNSPLSSKEDSFGAIEALIEKNWPVISKALKFNPTGEISMQSTKEAISEQMMGIFPKITLPDGKTINREGKRLLDTYNKKQKVTTFLDATLRPRQAEIFTRAKTIDAVSQGVNLEEAKNIAVSTELENETSNQKDTRKRINVLKIPRVARVAKDIRQDTKVVEGDTHKQVTKNNEGHIGSKIFNIPANKITKPNQNLTTSDDIVSAETGEVITKEELDAGATGILSPSESKSVQDVFSDYNTTEQFIKILPKTNVSEKDALINEIGENIPVSRNVYGRAIGLQDRILEYFYEPLMKPNGKRARSQGKTSQVPLWTLKEEFINPKKDVIVQFQRDLGITEQQQVNILPTEEKRSEIGQLLKGAARTLSQQVSLSTAQRILEARGASKQQIADVTAGQRKRAYSKDEKINLDDATKKLNDKLNKSDNIIEAKEEAGTIDPEFIDKENRANLNSNLAYHGLDPMYTYDSATNIDFIVKEFKRISTILNQETANYTIFFKSDRHIPANLRKKLIVVNEETGQKMTVRDYYKQEIRKAFPDVEKPTYGKQFTGPGSKYKKGKTFAKIYGEKTSDFRKAMENGRNYEGSGKNAVKLTIPEINAMHESMGTQLWQRINDDISNNKENARIWANYLSLATNNTEHPHRQWAEFIAWTKKPLGSNSKGNTNPNSKGYKLYEWEHAMQSAKSINYLMHSILGDEYNFNIAFELIKENYKLIALDNYDDKVKLKKSRRTHSMGDGWSVLDAFHKRYQDKIVAAIKGKNGNGINPEGIETIFDGKTMGEHYNINVKGEPRLIKSELKDSKRIKKAITVARKSSKDPKGITVLDFDDTLATTKSLVKYTTPDGKTGTLNAEQYASTYEDLLDQGFTFDFSDFNKVVKGKLAPLFQKALKLQGKFGPENMFVLTARPPAAQKAIFDFLKANGLNIPIKNITGLGNSTSEAKALWIADKVGEGYNDFYFADDALQNVQAVKNMLDQFDVKSKVQQAKVKFSKDMNTDFNNILEEVTGIEAKKRFSDIKARKRGKSKGKFRVFIPPSHEDFVGLLYNFMGKGKKGDQHRDFFEQALVRPLNRAYREIDTAKQAIANDYKELNKQFADVKKKLTKKTPDGDFTFEDAIRVYLWNKHGYDIPGLSPTDQNNLSELVMNDPSLQAYAETLNVISKQDTYVDPGQGWEGGNIKTDLLDATGRVGRAEYFAEFNENAEVLFSSENLNKIEAAYGADFRSALEDILHRIGTGVNRPKGQSGTVNKFMNYLNGSVGTVMFFNVRSAILQQMSIVNYINFADNNMFAAAKAFANQKQYWKDFAFIFNSDMLKQIRCGIGTYINGNDFAQAVKGSKDPTKVVIGRLLKLGFLPTQIGDNIAIATGGATFYRNRVNKYIKDGLSKKEAETKAFTDFQDLTQSTQQSSRPDMTSQQQSSWIGKLVLNFQNITSQYNRIIKKAALDIGKGRISPPYTTKAQSNLGNLSKILYYGAIQNVIFYSLQTALFAVMFGDDEDEEQILKKKERVINGSIDSILRGAGIYGAVVSTLKNAIIKFKEQREKGYNKDESAVPMELLNFSPVVGIKIRQLVNAEKTLNYNENVISEMETFDADNPQWSAVTNYTQALTNFPANRLYQKSINMRNALDKDYTNFQRVLFFSGYTTWSLGLGDNEAIIEAKEKVKINKENARKEKRVQKQIEKIEANKSIIEENKKKSKKDGICSAISGSGERCKRKAVKDGMCTVHEKVEQNKTGKKSQCKKIKEGGKRCKMQTSNKSGYCYYHD